MFTGYFCSPEVKRAKVKTCSLELRNLLTVGKNFVAVTSKGRLLIKSGAKLLEVREVSE